MNNTNEKLNSDKHIIIVGLLSVFFSVFTGAPDFASLIFRSGVPFYCSVSFMVTKHPLFGFACAAFYLYNRIGTFSNKGTFLSTVMILAITAYFAYASYVSAKDWKTRTMQKGEKSRSKTLYGWLAFSQWLLILPYAFLIYHIYYVTGTGSGMILGATVLKWMINILNYVLAVVFIRKACKMPHLSTLKKVAWGIAMVLFTFLVFPLFWMVHVCREPRTNDEKTDCETSCFF